MLWVWILNGNRNVSKSDVVQKHNHVSFFNMRFGRGIGNNSKLDPDRYSSYDWLKRPLLPPGLAFSKALHPTANRYENVTGLVWVLFGGEGGRIDIFSDEYNCIFYTVRNFQLWA